MAKKDYSEYLLIQAPTAELLEKQPGWQNVFAQDEDDFGPDSLLGRNNDTSGQGPPGKSNAWNHRAFPSLPPNF